MELWGHVKAEDWSLVSEFRGAAGWPGRLWDIEDQIRACERDQDFGPRFISLARQVYLVNDRRADVKKRLNRALGSRLVEEKSYCAYRGETNEPTSI